MKKILIIINNFGVGGAERLVLDDANELSKRGDVVFKIITLKREGKNSLSDQLNKNIKWECVDFKGLFDLKSWFLLCGKVRDFNPDALFTHLWFSNTIGRIAGKMAGVKKVISFEHNVYDNLKTKKMFLTDWILQIFSHKIVAVSAAVKESLLKFGIKEDKIIILNNGIDLSRYSASRSNKIRLEFGIKNDSFVFVSVGRLIYQKGMDILIEAFSHLENNPVLLIVGQGSDERILKDKSHDLKISGRVFFLGIRHDIPEILADSDCFVLASRYEGLGTVVLEAMAARLPVVSSDFPAGKNFIVDGKTALVFHIGNVSELSKKMSLLVEGKSDAKKMTEKAFARINDFSVEMHLNRLLSLC